MLGKRIGTMILALWFIFTGGSAAAKAENAAIFRNAENRKSVVSFRGLHWGPNDPRSWWGVLYEDALLLARMDEPENEEETEQAPETVEFVWPFWEWLLSLLGLADGK